MSTQPCEQPRCSAESGVIELRIESKPRDIGEMMVRRVLPSPERQRVGPFIFFDQMGPARFAPGQGLAVRPHPHIGLATLTYLFEGVILHRDSLGFVQPIEPGAANWMTAGRGIVHSERTPEEAEATGSALHGLQVWLALPLEQEESEPSFVHHPAASLPRIRRDGADLRLVVGDAWGERSPVVSASETLYLAGELEPGADLALPDEPEERAVYVAEGEVRVAGEVLSSGCMGVLRSGCAARVEADEKARIAVVGGAPLPGERHLWWNFVSSSRQRLEQAKKDWSEGRFATVPGDPEFIPLPDDR
jgi:redox-sensitive bicupin YhaK (pirin superfamily)